MATKMQLDLDKIEAFASRGLTREQVAHNLGVSAKTLQRRTKERADVEEAYQRGKAKGIAKIANALFEKAMEGNTTAQIFFLKCNGWKEASEIDVKSSVSGVNGGPVEIKNVSELSNNQLLNIIDSYKKHEEK